MFVPKLEQMIGIGVYATASLGIGGFIRQTPADFVVEEMLVDGSRAEINKSVKGQVLGSSSVRNRYLLCVMVKRNWDTFQAIRVVSEQLGISMRQIQFAGIKDAKALTAQHISVEGVSAEEIQKVHVKDIEIRPIGYFRGRLSSYYLLGNSFDITIRAISRSESTIRQQITKIVEELELVGPPNFFGHQRFGTTRPITHLVGNAIVKGDIEEAAMLFLAKPSPYEHPESRKAREQLQATADFKKAAKNFPEVLRHERLMLEHLSKKPDDFRGAFRRLPIKLRELFLQAYQSYLFNKFLSRRIEKGIPLNRADVGDYVVNVERSGLPMLTMYKTTSAETLKGVNEAIESGKMRIALPLVGFKQHLSLGLQGEIEKQILEEEDVKPENFKIKGMPEIASTGELRTAITPLNKFSLDEISSDTNSPSKRKAKLSFMLYRGSYATTILRELMKPRGVIRAGF